VKTPDYVQITGFIDQSKINIKTGDSGGEMDPHGADLRGNPLGGLVYSNAFPSNNNNNATFQQVIEWHNFMGNDIFCFKACDSARPNAARYCEHVFDRIGCKYNAPAAYKPNVFESCMGESQDFPGVYTSNGAVLTYAQPPEALGPIATIPYEPRIPASSNCVVYQSAALYSALGTVPSSTSGSGAAASGASGSRSGSAAASATAKSGAMSLKAVSSLGSLASVLLFAAVVLFT